MHICVQCAPMKYAMLLRNITILEAFRTRLSLSPFRHAQCSCDNINLLRKLALPSFISASLVILLLYPVELLRQPHRRLLATASKQAPPTARLPRPQLLLEALPPPAAGAAQRPAR